MSPTITRPAPGQIRLAWTDPFPFAIRITRRPRGAGGHYWEACWFPCWRLTCAWSVYALGAGSPTEPERVPLARLLAEMDRHRNAQYLPGPARAAVRQWARARQERATAPTTVPATP